MAVELADACHQGGEVPLDAGGETELLVGDVPLALVVGETDTRPATMPPPAAKSSITTKMAALRRRCDGAAGGATGGVCATGPYAYCAVGMSAWLSQARPRAGEGCSCVGSVGSTEAGSTGTWPYGGVGRQGSGLGSVSPFSLPGPYVLICAPLSGSTV